MLVSELAMPEKRILVINKIRALETEAVRRSLDRLRGVEAVRARAPDSICSFQAIPA